MFKRAIVSGLFASFLSFAMATTRVAAESSGAVQDPPEKGPPKEQNIIARVVISFVLDDDGIPTNLTVVSSTNPEMNQKALDIVAQWRLKPGHKGTKFQVPVEFSRESEDHTEPKPKEKAAQN